MKRRDAEYRPPPTLVGGGFSRVASSLNAPSILSSTARPASHIFNASVLSCSSASTSPCTQPPYLAVVIEIGSRGERRTMRHPQRPSSSAPLTTFRWVHGPR
jgi:hypothetical protein